MNVFVIVWDCNSILIQASMILSNLYNSSNQMKIFSFSKKSFYWTFVSLKNTWNVSVHLSFKIFLLHVQLHMCEIQTQLTIISSHNLFKLRFYLNNVAAKQEFPAWNHAISDNIVSASGSESFTVFGVASIKNRYM